MSRVARNVDSPRHLFLKPRNTEILQAAFHKQADLVQPGVRDDKIAPR